MLDHDVYKDQEKLNSTVRNLRGLGATVGYTPTEPENTTVRLGNMWYRIHTVFDALEALARKQSLGLEPLSKADTLLIWLLQDNNVLMASEK